MATDDLPEATDHDLVVRDTPERQRFEAQIDGALAGFLEYVNKRGRLALIHTEVGPGHQGMGVGAALVRFAIDDARRQGLRVIAICPYVQSYLVRHPEDLDIVVPSAVRG